jgi:hypothetical protein
MQANKQIFATLLWNVECLMRSPKTKKPQAKDKWWKRRGRQERLDSLAEGWVKLSQQRGE